MEKEKIDQLGDSESLKINYKHKNTCEQVNTSIVDSVSEQVEDHELDNNKIELKISRNLNNAEPRLNSAVLNVELLLSSSEVSTVMSNGCPIKKVASLDCEIDSKSGKAQIESNASSAFTKCQIDHSCTEDSESDSEESESSEESDSESSQESDTSKAKTASEDASSSDEDDNVKKQTKPRNGIHVKPERVKLNKKKNDLYKGELDLEDLPPIEDLHITVPEEECEPLGTVISIVNQLVVVESFPNRPALDLDSLLFKKYGECLGRIFDVFGPVKTPFYSLRFNSRQEISEKGIEVGQTVCCAPQTPHTKYVFVYQLMRQKGSDASWKHNYEVPDNLVEYSDDEEERKARRKNHQKARVRPSKEWCNEESPQKKRLGNPNYSQQNQDEWYRARISELNQFNRFNPNQQNSNTFRQSSYSHNSSEEFPHRREDSSRLFCASQSVLRPPTQLIWNPPPRRLGSQENNIPLQPPVVPQNWVPPVPRCAPFSSPPPPPFTHQQPYERLNSPVHFSNPVHPFANRPPPFQSQFNRPRSNPSFRGRNTRQTNLLPPRPLHPTQFPNGSNNPNPAFPPF